MKRGKGGRGRKVSLGLTLPYQQFPSSPCRISEGLGVRNTDHVTDRSLKMLQLISWGRSHCFTLCCTLSPSGNPTDLGPGWKLSSTKLTLFCKSKRQGEHQCAAVRHIAPWGRPGEPPTTAPGVREESPALLSGLGSPFRCHAGEQVWGRASAGKGTDAFCAPGPAFSPAMNQLTSPGPKLQTATQICLFFFYRNLPGQ